MTITVMLQDISGTGTRDHPTFSCVDVQTKHGVATLFLPAGKAQAVADAINAAIAVDAAEPAEGV